LLISGILIILGVFVIFNYSQILKWWEVNFKTAGASIDAKIRGWAWGENMGWISMNCYNDFDYNHTFENCCPGGDAENCTSPKICQGGSKKGQACSVDDDCPDSTCSGLAGGDYGVYYDKSNKRLRGYAWSDKVGWICFGETCGSTTTPHGWPSAWACVGRPTWVCSNDDSQTCSNNNQCAGDCIFSCSGDGGEEFLDITAQGAPCYSFEGDTLRAHWKMNTINAVDSSNQIPANNGTLMPVDNPPILANGKFENALQFDGTNDYIYADDSDSLSVTGNLVVEAWIKRAGRCVGGTNEDATCFHNSTCSGGGVCTLVNSKQTIIGKWDESLTEHQKSYRLWFDANNRLNFSVANASDVEATITQTQGICFGYEGDGSAPCSSDADCSQYGDGILCRNPSIIDTTKWHHVAGKYTAAIGTNATSLRLFIDGLQVMSSNCIGGDNDGLPCSNNRDCLPGGGICGAKWSGTLPALLSDKDNKLYIGAKRITPGDDPEDLNTYFNGIIDNVAIWSCDGNASFVPGRSAKDIWNDAKMEISGWAKVVALGDRGWLKLQGFTKAGKVWGLYLNDYDTFYTIGGYMANRHADTSMDTTGLIANWLMDEPSWVSSAGLIPVEDSSPSGNNPGTAYGAVPNVQSIFNSAGEFDGDDYIEVADNASLDFGVSDDFTIQFWVKPNSFSATGSIPIIKRGIGVGYEIGITSDGTISWKISDNQENSDSTDALNLNAWNHVAIVFDRDNGITRYLNGDASGSVGDFGGLGDLSNNLSLYIGGKLDTYSFNGLIDNVSIYNVARTAAQIEADYNKQNPYCVGWDDYGHHYGHPPAPFDFEILEIINTEGCEQLFVYWEPSVWAESYTYWRCDDVLEAQCDACPGGYTERNVLSGACDESECSLQDAGLSENTGYCYKIQAHNETGSTYNSDGPEWKQTTLCSPEAPTINDDICGEIQLTWGWDPEGSADGYNIYNSLSSSENFGIISHLGEGVDYTGLMAQWKMNETSWDGSNKEVRDSSGQTPANHGTAKNSLSTTSAGKFNYAGNFDDIEDNYYIDCGSSNNLEVPTTTIQAWIKRGSTNTRDVIITDNDSSELSKDHHLWFEVGSDDKLAIIFGDGTDGVTKYSAGTINDTNWHHVVVVRDHVDAVGGTITFYIDGEAEAPQPYGLSNTMVSLGSDDIWIGKSNATGFEGPFHGLIDNLSIYNVARTAEQIKFDYEAGNCGYDNCSLGGECHIQGEDTNCGYALDDPDNCEGCGCHLEGLDTNCGYELGDPDSCQGCYVCHVLNNDDRNCGKKSGDAGDPSICCYTDKRILPYVNYYYKTTATSEAGESPFSSCDLTGDDCPATGDDPCCPNGNTICFPPVETEEE